MLNKKEKAVMKAIYYKATENNGSCLLRPIEILTYISSTVDIGSDELLPIIKELELDNYFELVESSRKTESIWCFTLHQKGHGFYREILNEKRLIYFKITLSVAVTLGIFFLKLILDAIAK